jgi:hypothetical protein
MGDISLAEKAGEIGADPLSMTNYCLYYMSAGCLLTCCIAPSYRQWGAGKSSPLNTRSVGSFWSVLLHWLHRPSIGTGRATTHPDLSDDEHRAGGGEGGDYQLDAVGDPTNNPEPHLAAVDRAKPKE